ncbi:DUF4418 family protein [Lagierella massiliensis]|uniref:DUF4418 family protein n=1 Tax=Lagierella massiliensis TaxID=1689303 RepID=UPI0009EBA66D|nr:DUF4418 family protein [Lagierella massiliensis]
MIKMKNNAKKICNILAIVASIVLIIGLKTFATPCEGMIETAKGMEVPMKCHWTDVALLYLAVATIVVGIANIIKNSKSILELIGIGVLSIAITMNNVGIGVCKMEGMACHTMKTFAIVIGVVFIVLGILQMFIKNEVEL